MTADFRRWEVDPFFTAAEEVQDSADRLESAYRTWKHLKLLAEMSPGDLEGANLVDFRQRELSTALGTAKWQLEEFERAVAQAPSKDEEDAAALRHSEFVKAIQNQISETEKSLCQLQDFNFILGLGSGHAQEKDDGLASFLSGAKSTNNKSLAGGLEKENTAGGDAQINLSKDALSRHDGRRGALKKDETLTPLLVEKRPLIASDISIVVHNVSDNKSDKPCNGQSERWATERGRIAISSHFSKSRDNLHIEEDRREALGGERRNGHRRTASLGSILNSSKSEGGVNTSEFVKHAKHETVIQASSNNGFNNFLGLFNMKYPVGKLRISKIGFKRWKDGDTNSRDCEQMLGYIDAQLESSNNWVARNTNISNGHVSASNIDAKQNQLLGWGGSLQKHLHLTPHAFPSSRAVQLASAILVALGLVGLLSFHAGF